MMPLSYKAIFPKNIKITNLSGEAGGHRYIMLVEESTNRILLIINETLLKVRKRGALPTPTPVTYAPYHTLREMNIRLQPNTYKPTKEPLNGVPTNTDLMLSTEPVTPALLQRLGLPALEIESGYQWRHIIEGNFIASKIGSKDTVAPGAASTPTPPPPPATSNNLKVVSANGKMSVAIKGTTRMVEGGINSRELAFCGLERVTGTSQADIPALLDHAKALGVKLVRFYTACVDVDAVESANRVQYVLDELQRRDMLGIMVLNDSLASGFCIPGDENYRVNMPHGHLSFEWYARKAYTGNYFNHVRILLGKVGKHPAFGSADSINEMGGYGRQGGYIPVEDTAAMRQFAVDSIALVRSLAPNAWVNLGIINAAHAGCDTPEKVDKFYRGLGLNAIGVHLYDELNGGWVQEGRALVDLAIARKLGLPVWIDEIGVHWKGTSRVGEYRAAIERYKAWAGAILYWGFNPLSPHKYLSDDLGVSVHLSDYNELAALVRGYR